MKKIVFTGPECSGKTTLCKSVADYLQINWVAEYARSYLNDLNRPYEEEDLLKIAKGQVQQEKIVAENETTFLLCDTSLLVLKIWSDYKYNRCHPFILESLQKDTTDLYFLCSPDIPWEEDPLREHPQQRQQLFSIYESALIAMKKPYIILEGEKIKRKEEALKLISIYDF